MFIMIENDRDFGKLLTNFPIKTKFEMQMELLGERVICDLMFNIKVGLYKLDYSGCNLELCDRYNLMQYYEFLRDNNLANDCVNSVTFRFVYIIKPALFKRTHMFKRETTTPVLFMSLGLVH